MPIPKKIADIVSELPSGELEIFCGLKLGTSREALALQLTALTDMIDRFDTGKKNTAIDRLKADKQRAKSKKIIAENPFLLSNPQHLNLLAPTKKKRFFTTDWIYADSTYFTRLRLFGTRLNRIAARSSRFLKEGGFLPSWFPWLGVIGGIVEAIGDLSVSITSIFKKPKKLKTGLTLQAWQQFKVSFIAPNEQLDAFAEERIKHAQHVAEKWPRLKRLKNVLAKGTRIVRMINASAVPLINFLCIQLPIWAAKGIITTTLSLTFLVALNIGIAVLDIILDGCSALYIYYKHHSLSKKLNKLKLNNQTEKLIDPEILNTALDDLSNKKKRVLINRVFRVNSSNLAMLAAMVLIQASLTSLVTPLLGVVLLTTALLFTLADLGHFALDSKFEKARATLTIGLVAIALVSVILLMVMPPLSPLLAFSIPFFGATNLSLSLIGSALALTVGSLAFARGLFLSFTDPDTKIWWEEKRQIMVENFQIAKAKIKSVFIPNAKTSPTLAYANIPEVADKMPGKNSPPIPVRKSSKITKHSGQHSLDPKASLSTNPLSSLSISLTDSIESPSYSRHPTTILPPLAKKINQQSQARRDSKATLIVTANTDMRTDTPPIAFAPSIAPAGSPQEEVEAEALRQEEKFSPLQSPAISSERMPSRDPSPSPKRISRSQDELPGMFKPQEPTRRRALSSPRQKSTELPSAGNRHR